jgi:hypothetical protein
VAPPSKLAAETIPREPAFDQRSCCQAAIRLRSFSGLTAIDGSTSLFE